MISAATQSSAKTTYGRRYVLAILNSTAGSITPVVTYDPPGSYGDSSFTPENTSAPIYWTPGEIKHVVFTAWGDGIRFSPAAAGIYWRLVPVLP